MSRLDIAERRVPQDGRIKMKISKNRAIDFRVSTCPTIFGEKVVMRILDSSSAMLGIDSLGYEPFQRQLYLDALARPHGMILVTGPTGSGKTMSLYTGLAILNKEDANISRPRIRSSTSCRASTRCQSTAKVGLTFARRAALHPAPGPGHHHGRRNPRRRDRGDRRARPRTRVTWFFRTLHTNDAPKTLTRLVDMGVKPYAIATSVSLIIAQRLARRLCSNCKTRLEVPEEALLEGGLFAGRNRRRESRFFGPVGCTQCTDGYKGRTGIYEVMPVSEEIGRIIMEGGNVMHIKQQAVREGVWGLRQSGLKKVRDGITSLDEINRVTVD